MLKKFFLVIMLVSAFASPLSVVAAEKVVSLSVSNMTCPVCPITVRKALEKVPGVSKAEVDYDSATAVVHFDSTKASAKDLIDATTNAGYPSKQKP